MSSSPTPSASSSIGRAPIIDVAAVSFEYPGRRALDEVGFTLEAGSVTALVGPNGAGKTTLLRCLAGLDRPLDGRISVAGVDVIAEPRLSHRALGYLSDFFGLYGELSVRRCLAYVARANAVPTSEIAERVASTAAALGLAERLDQPTASLSRGLRQRVAIGQAIIHGPRVVLLDEPAAGLDPEARYELGELFVDLRARGITLLVSSHILAELEAYSTDMLVMRDGRVIDHQRLGTQLQPSMRLRIGISDNSRERLVAVLDADPQITEVEPADGVVECRFSGDDTARAELLAGLVSTSIAVHEFTTVHEDLQQSYLRSIKGPKANDEP